MSATMKRRLGLLERDAASKSLFDLSCVPFNKDLKGKSAMQHLCEWLSRPEQDHLYGLPSGVVK